MTLRARRCRRHGRFGCSCWECWTTDLTWWERICWRIDHGWRSPFTRAGLSNVKGERWSTPDSAVIDPRTLVPGAVIRHKTGNEVVLSHRKEDGSGWWNTDGSGLVDWVCEKPGEWQVVTAPKIVPWGWDCIDCHGDFGMNDACDSCGGTNRIQLYATEADAERFGEAARAEGTGSDGRG